MGLLVFAPPVPLPPGKKARYSWFQRQMILAHLQMGLESELAKALMQHEAFSKMELEMVSLAMGFLCLLASS
jgi:hypothetical protein